ncbi:hypothetical protein [Spirochaeta cellobiosiphila]|uniref:hypothetical protein n=1 Tax=Spirochaeta cellobiosiphila TaxID=504483 RepID=UPI00048D285D|nr:hypothetical protein [Spirochaeta cellobiosiphila]
MVEWLVSFFPVLVVAILIFNIYQKKYGEQGIQKRMATFFMAAGVLGLFAVITFLKHKGLPVYYAMIYLVAVVVSFILNRKRAWPYKLKCEVCGQRLGWEDVLFLDGNTHSSCRPVPTESIEEATE